MAEITTEPTAAQELDIRGVTCPITFVKSKLKLETMASGEILRILIDYQPSAVNVPRSLENEGHHIVSMVEQDGPLWTLTVRKA